MRSVEDGAGGARVTVDERGRSPGRGAYLCAEQACWDRALRSDALARALRGAVTDTDRDTLQAFAARRLAAATMAAETMTEGAR